MRLRGMKIGLVGIAFLLAAIPALGLSVSGQVFFDRNGDGSFAAGDSPLERVAVSDGREVVLTDASGSYRLETEAGRIVFVSLPSGYLPAKSFYAVAKEGESIDFPTADWPESRSEAVRFVQITDIHITNEDTVNTFNEDTDEINALDPKTTFVIATGDLVNQGAKLEEYQNYVKAISRFKAPFFSVIGNHDLCGGTDRLKNYRDFLGPDYYSFNVGDCHFVAMNCMDFDANDIQKNWIEKDLAAAPKGYHRIFAQHFLPTRPQLEYLAGLGGSAILSGHWHGNRVWESFGILDVNTPPLRFGGIDRNGRGFRIMEMKNGKPTSEMRLAGFRERATVVSPAGPVFAPKGKVRVIVNAYDTRAKVAQVECQVGEEKLLLKPAGEWSWVGDMKVSTQSGTPKKLVARVTDTRGQTWLAESSFSVEKDIAKVVLGGNWSQFHGDHQHLGVADDHVHPPLKLAWTAHTGGVIGISSPVVSDSSVVIGISDVGDLKGCGIAAYDARSGSQRWRFKADSAIKNSVALADGRVFAISVAGYLYALDAGNGNLLWKQGLKRKNERWEVAAPVVSDGVVYAGGTTYLAAYDMKGERLWDVELKGNDWWPSCYIVPIVLGDRVIITSRVGAYALDRKTGETLWSLDGNYRGCSAVGPYIYAIRNNLATAIDPADKRVVWEGTEKLGDSGSAPAVAGGTMVVGDADGRVCAFSTRTCKLLWTYQTGTSVSSLQPYKRNESDVNSSPAISGDTVYVGASDGCLYALSLKTGEKLWSHNVGVPIASSPAICGNAVYVGAYDGNVYAFVGE